MSHANWPASLSVFFLGKMPVVKSRWFDSTAEPEKQRSNELRSVVATVSPVIREDETKSARVPMDITVYDPVLDTRVESAASPSLPRKRIEGWTDSGDTVTVYEVQDPRFLSTETSAPCTTPLGRRINQRYTGSPRQSMDWISVTAKLIAIATDMQPCNTTLIPPAKYGHTPQWALNLFSHGGYERVDCLAEWMDSHPLACMRYTSPELHPSDLYMHNLHEYESKWRSMNLDEKLRTQDAQEDAMHDHLELHLSERIRHLHDCVARVNAIRREPPSLCKWRLPKDVPSKLPSDQLREKRLKFNDTVECHVVSRYITPQKPNVAR